MECHRTTPLLLVIGLMLTSPPGFTSGPQDPPKAGGAAAVTGNSRPPVIQVFTATPAQSKPGQPLTLRWSTSDAEQTWIVPSEWTGSGMIKRADNTVPANGTLEIRPDKTTSYTLIARNSAREVTKRITVPIAGEATPCEISGRISGDRREYATRVMLYLEGVAKSVGSVPVKDGEYRFESVATGRYRVVPTGKFPTDKVSVGPEPRSANATCRPLRRIHLNFKIVSSEG